MANDRVEIFRKINKVRLANGLSKISFLEKAGFSAGTLEHMLSVYDYYVTGLKSHEPGTLKKMAEIVGLDFTKVINELHQSKQTQNMGEFIDYLARRKFDLMRNYEGINVASDEEKRILTYQLGMLHEVISHLPKDERDIFEAKYKETKEYTYWD